MEKALCSGSFAKAAGDPVSGEAMRHDIAGLNGPEVLSLVQDGTLQLAVRNISDMAGKHPRVEAPDPAGAT